MTKKEFKEIMEKRSKRSFEERSAEMVALNQAVKFFYMLGQRNPDVRFDKMPEAKDSLYVYHYFFPLDLLKDIPEYWEKRYSGDNTDIINIRQTLAKRLKTNKHNLL